MQNIYILNKIDTNLHDKIVIIPLNLQLMRCIHIIFGFIS